MMSIKKTCFWGCAALMVAALFVTPNAGAATVTFTLDPSLSSMGLAGSFSVIPLFPQAPGADVTSYTGTIDVAVTGSRLAPTSIAFVGGSAIADVNGVWLPNDVLDDPGPPGCVASTKNCGGDDPNVILGDADPGLPAPGNYGLGVILTSADLGLPPGLGEAMAFGAVRDAAFSLTSGAEPVAGGAFASTQTLTFDSGVFDSNLKSTLPVITGIEDSAGSDPLTGDTADFPNGAGAGSYSVAGGVITLKVPADFVFLGDVTLAFTGVLVGTALVPEPTSLLLLAVGASMLAGMAVGRRRLL